MFLFVVRLLLFFFIIVAVLLFFYSQVKARKEYEMLNSESYKKACRDWVELNDWFVSSYPAKQFYPFSVHIDTGYMAGRVIDIRIGPDGRLSGLDDSLSPEEFIMAVERVKWFFDYPGSCA